MGYLCYRCGQDRIIKNGVSSNGYQKYRCANCGHSFTSKTEYVGYQPRSTVSHSSTQAQSVQPHVQLSQAPPINNFQSPLPAAKSCKDKTTAIILAACGFIGIAGLHQFYVGKKAIGIAYLFTFGFFFIGTIIDIILLCTGKFKDSNGFVL